jgi:hypothetical protein
MEKAQPEEYEKKVGGFFQKSNRIIPVSCPGNTSDTTIEDSNMNGVGTTLELTENRPQKNYYNTPTQSSENNEPQDVMMHQPVITINRRGWTSRVVPN